MNLPFRLRPLYISHLRLYTYHRISFSMSTVANKRSVVDVDIEVDVKSDKKMKMTDKPFTIMSYNVNGLRAAIKKGLGEYLTNSNADIICMQEIKVEKKQLQIEKGDYAGSFPYQYYHSSRAKKGYSGTAILSKVKPIKVSYGLTDGYIDDEGRAITCEFEDFVLINTYVPNSGATKQGSKMPKRIDWNKHMDDYVKSYRSNERMKPVIWTGDFNVAHLDYDVFDGETNKRRCLSAGFTPQERNHFTNVLSTGLVDVYRNKHPEHRKEAWTFFSPLSNHKKNFEDRVGWRLDYFVVSPGFEDQVTTIESKQEVIMSDHCPLIMKFNRKTINNETINLA